MGALPRNCRRALDVGCGNGFLSMKLAPFFEKVVGIDIDHQSIPSDARVAFVEDDVMKYPFEEASFDLIAAVASLHHLPLQSALTRFRSLLKPGGVLAVVGLYRASTIADRLWDVVAVPASWMIGRFRGRAAVSARMKAPAETLCEIRMACDAMLPGHIFHRRLFFRYTLVWQKPGGN